MSEPPELTVELRPSEVAVDLGPSCRALRGVSRHRNPNVKLALLHDLGWLDVTEVYLGAFHEEPEHVRQKKGYHRMCGEDPPDRNLLDMMRHLWPSDRGIFGLEPNSPPAVG